MVLFRRHKRSPTPPPPQASPPPAARKPGDRVTAVSAAARRGVPFIGEPHEPSRQDWSNTHAGQPWAPATWLAYPTLTHGAGSQYKLAGAYHHRAEIHEAYRRFGGLVTAELRIETEGSFAGAVRAFVDGVQLATVPHQHTLDFQTAVETLGRKGSPATAHVRLEADQYVDVWAFCEPRAWEQDEPFLCPQETEDVRLGPSIAEELDRSLNSRAKNKKVVRRGQLHLGADGIWSVTLDEKPIGTLNKRPFLRLHQAMDARLPLDAHLDIRRRDGRPLAVSVGVPRDD